MVDFVFQRMAQRELREASAWYGLRSELTRQRFRRAVFEAMDRIEANPEAHPVNFAPYRCVRVRRYPYIIIFEIRSPTMIVITAVAHTSRRPRYWRRRKA